MAESSAPAPPPASLTMPAKCLVPFRRPLVPQAFRRQEPRVVGGAEEVDRDRHVVVVEGADQHEGDATCLTSVERMFHHMG